MPDEQALAVQSILYQQGRERTEKLLGGTEGLQGLPHETPVYAEYKMQKDNQNDL